jgi:hypothetical protein
MQLIVKNLVLVLSLYTATNFCSPSSADLLSKPLSANGEKTKRIKALRS